MPGYFAKNSDKLRITSQGIRNCQRGAFYATLAHFSRSNSPCLIGLPTGSGKTALMMALCLGLKVKRALIVTPASILRSQTAEKFGSLSDLIQADAFPKEEAGPNVFEALHEFQSHEEWDQCSRFDVTVATPNITSPLYERVSPPPPDLFEVVFIDEAHHVPAKSWAELLDTFHSLNTMAILLTGTPFRRDRIEIAADLIYDYPIGLAMDDQIFAPVKFINIRHQSVNRDKTLARKCLHVLDSIQDTYGDRPLALIKTDRKNHADELCDVYAEFGLKVKAIHTDFTDAENKVTIDALKSGAIDGIVAVGMVGEGLDIPKLKLAVFHRNPQSLPHTIQLIGRLSRVGTKIEEGHVIGYSDDFSRETFKLYDAAPDWLKLIPLLERKLVSGRVGENVQKPLGRDEDFLFEADLNPYFTITAYSTDGDPKAADLTKLEKWNRSSDNRHDTLVHLSMYKSDTIVVVTKSHLLPDWIKTGGYSRILQEKHNLHLFFQNKNIVLEYTTDPEVSSSLRFELFGEDMSRVGKDTLTHALENGDGSYVVVGLKNSAGISYGNPSYKMLMGREAQASIQNTDTKVFHPGHALMRLKRSDRSSEVRGIAYKKSRIWALRRDNLKVFRDWCLAISGALLSKNQVKLPGLERLRSTSPVTSFPGIPLAMVHNTYLLNRSVKVEPIPFDAEFSQLDLRRFVVSECEDKKLLFSIEELDAKFMMEIDDKSFIRAEKISGKDYTVIVDPVDGVTRRYPITEFLEEFPPRLLFPDGTSIVDGVCSSPTNLPIINEDVLVALTWKGCDINSEENDTVKGISVQRFVEQKYLPSVGKATLVINDHASYEIADTISIDLIRNHITLYHIKSARSKKGVPQKPGKRKADLQDVLSQAITSCIWIRNMMFAEELLRRINERKATDLVKGSIAEVAKFASVYSPSIYSFEVVIVQPALIGVGLRDPIKEMIAAAQDYVIASGGSFGVLCSP